MSLDWGGRGYGVASDCGDGGYYGLSLDWGGGGYEVSPTVEDPRWQLLWSVSGLGCGRED